MTKAKPENFKDLFDHFQKDLIGLLAEAMQIGGGAFSKYEIMITYPSINLYLHYLGGVEMGLRESNFIVAMSSLRGMIESLAALIYDGTARMNKKEYEKFYKEGRFYKQQEDGKLVEMSQRGLIRHMKDNTGFDALKTYDLCCSYLHFSTKHVGFMVNDFKGKNSMDIMIGKKDRIPATLQKDIMKACSDASILMHRVILGLIEERKRNHEK